MILWLLSTLCDQHLLQLMLLLVVKQHNNPFRLGRKTLDMLARSSSSSIRELLAMLLMMLRPVWPPPRQHTFHCPAMTIAAQC
jgi:hypothetical protein